MTDDQRVMYDNAGEVRNTDVMLRWNIAGIFLTLHNREVRATAVAYLIGGVLGILWGILVVRSVPTPLSWGRILLLIPGPVVMGFVLFVASLRMQGFLPTSKKNRNIVFLRRSLRLGFCQDAFFISFTRLTLIQGAVE